MAAQIKDFTEKYNNMVKNNPGVGEFKKVKGFKSIEEAIEMIEQFELMLEAANNPKVEEKKKEEKKKDKKADKTKVEAKEETAVEQTVFAQPEKGLGKFNFLQHQILCGFIDDEMKQAELIDILVKAGVNKTIIAPQLGLLEKVGLVKRYVSKKGEKYVDITKKGKELADGPAPEKAVSKPPKPKYTPLYTEEQLSEMKKKKRKAAEEEMAEHKAAWLVANPKGEGRSQSKSSSPSNYQGTIPVGKYQKEGKPGPVNAGFDLWETFVTAKLKNTKSSFIAECEKHNINKGTASQVWREMLRRNNISKEEAAAKGAVGVFGGGKKKDKKVEEVVDNTPDVDDDPAAEPEVKKEKKDKKNKKDKKKDKKNK